MRMMNKYLRGGLLAAAMLLPAACSKDQAAEPAPGERIEIVLAVRVAPDVEAGTKSPEDGSTSLTLQFLRADETASGTYGAYAATVLPATRAAGSGAQSLGFATPQYYTTNGLKSKLVGWYPAGTFSGGAVTWSFNGTQDIMTAPKQEGSASSAMPAFTFSHRLSQLQFFPYYDKADAASVWGKVTAVKVTGQRAACSFTPASAEGTGAVAFSGSTTTFTVAGASATTPGVGTAAAARFGEPLMIEPKTTSSTLTVTVTTEKGGDLVMTVPARTYPAGVSTKVWLKLSAFGFMADATIADWAVPEDSGIATSATYVPLYYGNAFQNGGTTTGLSGSTTASYDGYTIESNGSIYSSVTDAYTGEKPFYQLEVAMSDETEDPINWEDAWWACKNKITDGGGWRLPRLAELKLIQNNKTSLEAESGFIKFSTNSNSSNYWTGTRNSASTADYKSYFHVDLTFNSIGVSYENVKQRVRCVREPRRIGKVTNGGVVFWIDPVDPSHYKVVAMADQSGGGKWAVKAYGVGAAAQSKDDGKTNSATVKAYSLAHANDAAGSATKTTGNLADDFPAFGACENYDSGDGVHDWFLPATNEILVVFQNRDVLYPVFTANGGTACASADYWTSTENTYSGNNNADNVYMGSGGSYLHNGKTQSKRVRCIREFNR